MILVSMPPMSRRGLWRLWRRCKLLSTANSFSLASKILLDRFLHHCAEGHMLRLRQRPAVFIFGRVVGDRAVHVGNLNAHRTPRRIHRFPSSRECLAPFLAAAYAQGCGLGKDRR